MIDDVFKLVEAGFTESELSLNLEIVASIISTLLDIGIDDVLEFISKLILEVKHIKLIVTLNINHELLSNLV